MTIIKDPVRAYQRAREAFRVWNQGRKDPNDTGVGAVLRTSTKSGSAGTLAVVALSYAAEKWPSLEPLLGDPQFVAGVAVAVTYLVARFTKTATNPGKL